MSKKIKIASIFLATSLIITPISNVVLQNHNVAKAEENFKKNNENAIDNFNSVGQTRDWGLIIGITSLFGYAYTEWIKPYSNEWENLENTVNGWVSITNPSSAKKFWLYKENGSYKKGWHWDNEYNGWYYFYDCTLKIGDSSYSKLEKYITVMYDPTYNFRWLKLDNKWYEFQLGGKLINHSGWRKYNNRWLYHLPGDYGAVADQSRYIDGVWYEFDSNGYWVE